MRSEPYKRDLAAFLRTFLLFLLFYYLIPGNKRRERGRQGTKFDCYRENPYKKYGAMDNLAGGDSAKRDQSSNAKLLTAAPESVLKGDTWVFS